MMQQLLEQMAGGGWADLEDMPARAKKIADAQGQVERQEIERQAAIVASALSTADGKALLELLINITVLRQPDDVERGATTADAYAIAKAKREGQNSILFFLLARLQSHRGQEVTKPIGGEL